MAPNSEIEKVEKSVFYLITICLDGWTFQCAFRHFSDWLGSRYQVPTLLNVLIFLIIISKGIISLIEHGTTIIILVGILAGYTDLILWRLFVRLDSAGHPLKTCGDMAERILGTAARHVCTMLQSWIKGDDKQGFSFSSRSTDSLKGIVSKRAGLSVLSTESSSSSNATSVIQAFLLSSIHCSFFTAQNGVVLVVASSGPSKTTELRIWAIDERDSILQAAALYCSG
jgi:hypothetical protein